MKFLSALGKNWAWIILGGVIFLFTLQNFYFIGNNRVPPYADSPHHLNLARHYYNVLWDLSSPPGQTHIKQKYPPLLYLVTTVFFKTLGNNHSSALVSLYPFSLIFIVSLFLLGRRLGGDWGGVLSAIAGASSQLFMQMSHLYLLDMPQTAMTCLSLYLLVMSDRFQNRKYSIFFGLVFGLALLAKWSSAFYMAGPLAVYVLWLLRKEKKGILVPVFFALPILLFLGGIFIHGKKVYLENGSSSVPAVLYLILFIVLVLAEGGLLAFLLLKQKKRTEKFAGFCNLTLAGILSLLVSGGWFVYNIVGVLGKLTLQHQEIHGHFPGRERGLFSMSMEYYLKSHDFFFTGFLVMALLGVILIAFIKGRRLEKFAVFLSAPAGVLIISPLAPPASFYILSLLIPISVMAGYWVEKTGFFKFLFIGIFALYGYSSLVYPMEGSHSRLNFLSCKNAGYSLGFTPAVIPVSNDYRFGEITDYIRSINLKGGNELLPVGVFAFRDFGGGERIDFTPEVFQTLNDDRGGGGFEFFSPEPQWQDMMRRFEGKDMIFIIGYSYPGQDSSLPGYFRNSLGMKTRTLKIFEVSPKRQVKIIQLSSGSSGLNR